MKKSMIAAAVVATAFAASANAGYFQIAGASYNPGSTPLVPGNFAMNTSTTDFSLNSSGTANVVNSLNAADVTALGGISAAADTVTYFSYRDSSGLGYFGVIINSTVTRTMNIAMLSNNGDGASGGTKGVLTNASAGASQSVSGGTFLDSGVSIGIGKTFYVFGGLSNGDGFNGSVSRTGSTGATFGIAYLSWNGTGWTTMASLASGASGSSISVASYVVPVPAPALLAGAGLVGAAALRRRMAKKA